MKQKIATKSSWTVGEDNELRRCVTNYGDQNWNGIATKIGGRTANSCRLRWCNYLSPSVRRGKFSHDEKLLILKLHRRFGNRWSEIAKWLPGRTDNHIKNLCNTRVMKEAKQFQCDVESEEFLIQNLTNRAQAFSGESSYEESSIHSSIESTSIDEESSTNHGSIESSTTADQDCCDAELFDAFVDDVLQGRISFIDQHSLIYVRCKISD